MKLSSSLFITFLVSPFLVWCTNQQLDLQIFERDGRFGLREQNNIELIPPVYDQLGWSDGSRLRGEILGYKAKGKWGLITTKNKELTPPTFYLVEPFDGQYVKAAVTRSLSNQLDHGLVNAKGKVVLSCKYFSLEPAGGNVIAGIYENGSIQYGALNSGFEVIVPLNYDRVVAFDQLMLVMKDGSWRALNSSGDAILDACFDSYKRIGDYLEISKKGEIGLLDIKDQKVLIAPSVKEITYTSEGILTSESRQWEVYDRSLKKVLDVPGDSIFENGGLIISFLNGAQKVFNDSTELFPDWQFDVKQSSRSFLVIDDKGQQVWKAFAGSKEIAQGDSIYFDGGYFYVLNNKKWSIYNKYGRQTNERLLDAVALAQEMYVPVKYGGQWGMQDFRGDLVLNFAYDSISSGLGLTFPTKYVGSWGVLDAFGKWLIQPAYDSLYRIAEFYIAKRKGVSTIFSSRGVNLYVTRGDFHKGNNSVVMERNDNVGIISSAGVVIFDPIYDEVSHKGDFYLGKRALGSVVKDDNGEFVLELDRGFEEIYSWSEGFFHIKKNGLHGFVDESARLRIANRYDSARAFNEGMAAIQLRGKWGFIDQDEYLIVQPYYKEVSDYYKGLTIVRSEKFGLINKEGQFVFKPEFKSIARTSLGSYILTYTDGKVGLANAEGQILLSPSFDTMEDIGEGLIVVGREGKKGLYNESGRLLVSFEYEDIKSIGKYLALTRDPPN